MAAIGNCVEHNTFDDAAAVAASEIGPNGTVVGGAGFAAGKFNDGILNADNDDGVTIPDSNNDFWDPANCRRLWEKPVGWGISNGTSDDAGTHTVFKCTVDDGNMVYCTHTPTEFRLAIRAATVWQLPYAFTPAAMDGADGAKHHLAVTVNSAGMGDGDTRKIYWDGAEVDSSNAALTLPNLDGQTWYFARDSNGSNNPYAGVIDNPQIFNSDEQDHSDYLNEGFPVAVPHKMTPQRGYW